MNNDLSKIYDFELLPITLRFTYICLFVIITIIIVMGLTIGNIIKSKNVDAVKELFNKAGYDTKYHKYVLKGLQIYCPYKLKKETNCSKNSVKYTSRESVFTLFYTIYILHLSAFSFCCCAFILFVIILFMQLNNIEDTFTFNLFRWMTIIIYLIIGIIFIAISLAIVVSSIQEEKEKLLKIINICDDADPADPA